MEPGAAAVGVPVLFDAERFCLGESKAGKALGVP